MRVTTFAQCGLDRSSTAPHEGAQHPDLLLDTVLLAVPTLLYANIQLAHVIIIQIQMRDSKTSEKPVFLSLMMSYSRIPPLLLICLLLFTRPTRNMLHFFFPLYSFVNVTGPCLKNRENPTHFFFQSSVFLLDKRWFSFPIGHARIGKGGKTSGRGCHLGDIIGRSGTIQNRTLSVVIYIFKSWDN